MPQILTARQPDKKSFERRAMSYGEFTLEAVERQLGVVTEEADLFPGSTQIKAIGLKDRQAIVSDDDEKMEPRITRITRIGRS